MKGNLLKRKLLNDMKQKILGSKWGRMLLMSFCVNFILEILSRRGIWDGVVHLCTAPHIFLYNTGIVFFTITICLLFRKRRFMMVMAGLLWIVAGIIDYILLFFRKTPFTASDFVLIFDAFKIGPVYLGKWGFGLIVTGFLLMLIFAVFLWVRAQKLRMNKSDYLKAVGIIGFMWLVVFFLTVCGLKLQLLSKHYSNIGRAYEKYGFAYCFANSVINHGIEKPAGYSRDMVEDIVNEVFAANKKPGYSVPQKLDYPNVIFLQLESFFNPTLIKGVEYTENPVEYFERLVVDYPSGYLSVPAFGAGTANTEFEIMTGMNLDDFGPGEYPYKTVLKNTTCESTAYVLKELGYATHALHNNDGDFYSRNKVFSYLGFDDFTSIEYMGQHELTPTGWAKDEILVSEIESVLDSTNQMDYIYAISVQGHGDYPNDLDGMQLDVFESGFPEESEEKGFVYYINQLNEMDDFLKELTDMLSARSEKTILVLYGDHLPGFSITDDMLYNGDIYQTQYVVWSNYGLWLPKKSLEAYQLYPWVLHALDISEGIMNKYHQNYAQKEDYREKLTLLEYDMLYGEGKAYGDKGPYPMTDMKMGIREIFITHAYNYDGHICVEGQNFTSYSDVSLNGKIYTARCVNEHTLVVDEIQLTDGDKLTVVQRGEDKIELSETEVYVYSDKKEGYDEGKNIFDSRK